MFGGLQLPVKDPVETGAFSTIIFKGIFHFDEEGLADSSITHKVMETLSYREDIATLVDHAGTEMSDANTILDMLREFDPTFVHDLERPIIEVVGIFTWGTEQEGDYETGYHNVSVLHPEIQGYEQIALDENEELPSTNDEEGHYGMGDF